MNKIRGYSECVFFLLLSNLFANCKEFHDFGPLANLLLSSHKLNTVVIFTNDKFKDAEIAELNVFLRTSTKNYVPTLLLSRKPSFRIKDIFGRTNTLSVVFVDDCNDPILKEVNSALLGMRLSKIVFIFLHRNVQIKYLRKLFVWCWRQNMLNVVTLSRSKKKTLEIFTYNPFPKMRLYNLTGKPIKKIFQSKIKNLYGYKFQSPVKKDIPRVFKLHTPSGVETVTGIAGRTLLEFIWRKNGSFEEMTLKNSTKFISITEIFNLLQQKKIDISIHPYGHFNRSLSSASYPLSIPDWCLMVPVISEIPSFMYLILPFQTFVWLYILSGTITIGLARFWVSSYFEPKISLTEAICDSFRAVLNGSIPSLGRQNKWQNQVICGLAMLQGFILTNIYLASLTSFFTKTTYGRQIETPSDLIEAGLKIMLEKVEEKTLLESINFPKPLANYLVPVDADTLGKHRDKLNTTFSYPVATERWNYLSMQEQYLHRKTFRLSNICFGHFFLSFPMQLDSPFMKQLSLFIMQLQQAGIYNKWASKTFKEGLDAGLLNIRKEPDTHAQPMTITHFSLTWYILAIGYCISLCCFMVELIKNV